MLQRILKLMATDDATTQQDLARQLGVSEPLVTQMVDQLVQQGYLVEGGQCATTSCEGCGLQSACGTLESLKIWTLTEKGWRAVRK
jgi:predicted ArsR family transcriptional regulator